MKPCRSQAGERGSHREPMQNRLQSVDWIFAESAPRVRTGAYASPICTIELPARQT